MITKAKPQKSLFSTMLMLGAQIINRNRATGAVTENWASLHPAKILYFLRSPSTANGKYA